MNDYIGQLKITENPNNYRLCEFALDFTYYSISDKGPNNSRIQNMEDMMVKPFKEIRFKSDLPVSACSLIKSFSFNPQSNMMPNIPLSCLAEYAGASLVLNLFHFGPESENR